jgi:nucleotidyltransferase substrate binding protein (TIGR01987 family)
MDKPKLDYSSLEKPVGTPEIALNTYESMKDSLGPQERDIMRDGVIQRFEYSFELSWKKLKRCLEMYGLGTVDTLNNRDLFRIGFENGLLQNPEAWFHYLNDRNQTSHIYDPVVASGIFGSTAGFLSDAKFLLARLRKRVT